jgi:hypothetical protein
MKHALWGSQNYSGPQPHFGSLTACLGSNINYQLKLIPGIHNHANALSRRLDYDDSAEDNQQVIALPDAVFTQVLFIATLDKRIWKQQFAILSKLELWRNSYTLV